jgi:hypothetical protein
VFLWHFDVLQVDLGEHAEYIPAGEKKELFLMIFTE